MRNRDTDGKARYFAQLGKKVRNAAWTAAFGGMCFMASSTAFAQGAGWPGKPVRIIVGFPPGGGPDVIARSLVTGLSEALGQPIIVENKTGLTGMLAADAVARSATDGHVFLMTSGSSMSISVHTLDKLPLDPGKDLVPIAAVARISLFLISNTKQPFKTFAEMQSYARQNPGKLAYGSPGNGSAPHVATEMLKSQTGLTAVHIPYRGAAPALQDLLGGSVDFLFDPGIAFEHVRAGKLNLLAVGSSKRSPLFPNVPTLQELGVTGFDGGTTHGLYGPAGTPKQVIDRMNTEINRLLQTAQVASGIRAQGAEPTQMTPAEFAAQIQRDSDRYGAIVKARGIKE
jgi:tripartite-type tricarboxylate transporter receptor subunit TctC